MSSSSIKSAIPMPVRKQLIAGKWFLMRLPCAVQYRMLLLQQAPLERLVAFLPAPEQPVVYWTKLKNIKLHGSLQYPPAGHLCMDGDWDTHSIYPLPSVFEPIKEGTKKWDLHETIRGMFLLGQHYSRTPQYKAMIEAVEHKAGNPPQGCRTAEEVDTYFHRLMAAYESMQTNGYLTQKEQGRSSVEEIRVHLTREGRLCLGTGGNHRIRMAELLGITWVPILIRGIHSQWVIKLCHQLSMPPHKAINHWLNLNFYDRKPY